MPGLVGNPGDAFVLVDPEAGIALGAASPLPSTSAASTEDRCQLTFFHDSQHFGFGASSYPRLYIPNQLGQTKVETSPATLFLSGKMHEIALDGTEDAKFAEHSTATGKHLGPAFDQLKDM
ncbi:hypothetical protein BJY00DRAFT_293634 [Aspergillus carlsbadensis]|nr:hypothetical protein BJY00DRAFT_293634 [Aspergillus carlsbadensis]